MKQYDIYRQRARIVELIPNPSKFTIGKQNLSPGYRALRRRVVALNEQDAIYQKQIETRCLPRTDYHLQSRVGTGYPRRLCPVPQLQSSRGRGNPNLLLV